MTDLAESSKGRRWLKKGCFVVDGGSGSDSSVGQSLLISPWFPESLGLFGDLSPFCGGTTLRGPGWCFSMLGHSAASECPCLFLDLS
jgi:hypothetical protein